MYSCHGSNDWMLVICRSDDLMRSLVSGASGFKPLSRLLIMMLQTLLQDQIAEVSSPLGVALLFLVCRLAEIAPRAFLFFFL